MQSVRNIYKLHAAFSSVRINHSLFPKPVIAEQRRKNNWRGLTNPPQSRSGKKLHCMMFVHCSRARESIPAAVNNARLIIKSKLVVFAARAHARRQPPEPSEMRRLRLLCIQIWSLSVPLSRLPLRDVHAAASRPADQDNQCTLHGRRKKIEMQKGIYACRVCRMLRWVRAPRDMGPAIIICKPSSH